MLQRKVCMVGDFAVGKTSLFNRFVYNRFSDSYQSTIGVRVQRKIVDVFSHELALVLWDTEGGQDSSSLKESYLNGAMGAIVVCDLTRASTILHCEEYAQVLRRQNPHICITLAANKFDLVLPEHTHVAVAQQVAQRVGAPLTLSSASSGEGVEKLFQVLGEELFGAKPIA